MGLEKASVAQPIRIKDPDPHTTPKRTRTTKKIRALARNRRRVTKGLSLSVLFIPRFINEDYGED